MPPLQDDNINVQHDQPQNDPMEQMLDLPAQESMVLNTSDGSGSLVNGYGDDLEIVQHVIGLLQQNN
jgi:hypothetical protein